MATLLAHTPTAPPSTPTPAPTPAPLIPPDFQLQLGLPDAETYQDVEFSHWKGWQPPNPEIVAQLPPPDNPPQPRPQLPRPQPYQPRDIFACPDCNKDVCRGSADDCRGAVDLDAYGISAADANLIRAYKPGDRVRLIEAIYSGRKLKVAVYIATYPNWGSYASTETISDAVGIAAPHIRRMRGQLVGDHGWRQEVEVTPLGIRREWLLIPGDEIARGFAAIRDRKQSTSDAKAAKKRAKVARQNAKKARQSGAPFDAAATPGDSDRDCNSAPKARQSGAPKSEKARQSGAPYQSRDQGVGRVDDDSYYRGDGKNEIFSEPPLVSSRRQNSDSQDSDSENFPPENPPENPLAAAYAAIESGELPPVPTPPKIRQHFRLEDWVAGCAAARKRANVTDPDIWAAAQELEQIAADNPLWRISRIQGWLPATAADKAQTRIDAAAAELERYYNSHEYHLKLRREEEDAENRRLDPFWDDRPDATPEWWEWNRLRLEAKRDGNPPPPMPEGLAPRILAKDAAAAALEIAAAAAATPDVDAAPAPQPPAPAPAPTEVDAPPAPAPAPIRRGDYREWLGFFKGIFRPAMARGENPYIILEGCPEGLPPDDIADFMADYFATWDRENPAESGGG